MKRLFGIHMTPPDVAVVPPTSAAFSRISTRLPAARNTSAAQNEPAPLPTMMKSWVSLMAFSFCSNQNRGARYRSPRVPHAQRAVYQGAERRNPPMHFGLYPKPRDGRKSEQREVGNGRD